MSATTTLDTVEQLSSSTDELDQAIAAAEGAVAVLKAEKESLPGVYRAAMAALDASAALEARRRQGEIDVYLTIAEVRLRLARIARLAAVLTAQRAAADELAAAYNTLRSEHDRLGAEGAKRLDRDIAKARAADAYRAWRPSADGVQTTAIRIAQLRTQIDQLYAAQQLPDQPDTLGRHR